MKRPDNKMEEHEWIERYALGRMSVEENLHFEDELKKDVQLAQELKELQETYRLIKEAFLEESAISTIQRLQADDSGISKTVPLYRYFFLAAASVTILFISYLSLSMPEFPDSENDFTVVRSTNATTMPPDQRIIFDQFFEGQAHIVEGQYVMAVRNFEKVLESDNLRPYFREAAQWHLIVAYLKSGDLARAQQLYKRFEDCVECEYQVSSVNRWKIWWQIHWKNLV